MTFPAEQMVGLPAWANTERWDVVARVADERNLPVRSVPLSPELSGYLRQLLADRFKLTAHMEQRDAPAYALVVRNPGHVGADMDLSSVDCASAPCGISPSQECPRASCLHDVGVTMDQFAYDLRSTPNANMDRVVVNRTGLDGRYDLTVRWRGQPRAAARAAGTPEVPQADEVSIFSSIQDRLGLKLEPTTAPIDVLVIDHVERPTED
jgi:uncharacterized protein (TIGR03435 family)